MIHYTYGKYKQKIRYKIIHGKLNRILHDFYDSYGLTYVQANVLPKLYKIRE